MMDGRPAWLQVVEGYRADGRLHMKSAEDRIARALLRGLGLTNADKHLSAAERNVLGADYPTEPLITRAIRYMQAVYHHGEGFDAIEPDIVIRQRPPTSEEVAVMVEAYSEGTHIVYAWCAKNDVQIAWVLPHDDLENGQLPRLSDGIELWKNIRVNPDTPQESGVFIVRQPLHLFFHQAGPYVT